MALLAVGSHLRLVNVCVALRTLRSHVREHRLGVALRAGDAFMHPAQRILGGVVIELRNGANRFPAAQRVAVLTGNAKASVRTPRIRRRLRLRRRLTAGNNRRKNDCHINQECRTQGSPKLHTKGFRPTRRSTSISVSKVMRKNSNRTPSKLKQVRIVVEGYISTWISGVIS